MTFFKFFSVYIILGLSSLINVIIPVSGSATVTPFLAIITDPYKAIGLASFYFLLSGVIRMLVFWKNIQWNYVKKLLPLSLVGSVAGATALLKIPPLYLLVVIFIFTLYFLVKKVSRIYGTSNGVKKNRFSQSVVGIFSGFLQGTGLAGSDIRNNYLYSENLELTQVHGTTAFLGAGNFLVATIVRIFSGQISFPDITPFVFIIPFILIGTLGGKFILHKIGKRETDWILVAVMSFGLLLLGWKIITSF